MLLSSPFVVLLSLPLARPSDVQAGSELGLRLPGIDKTQNTLHKKPHMPLHQISMIDVQ